MLKNVKESLKELRISKRIKNVKKSKRLRMFGILKNVKEY